MEEGGTLTEARRKYRRFLGDGLKERERSPFKEAVAGMLLGSEAYVERMKAWLSGQEMSRAMPQARALRPEVKKEEIEAAVCKAYRVKAASLRERGKHGNEARQVAMWLCRRLTRMKVGEIARRYGGVSAGGVSVTVKKVKERADQEVGFARRLKRLEGKVAKTK